MEISGNLPLRPLALFPNSVNLQLRLLLTKEHRKQTLHHQSNLNDPEQSSDGKNISKNNSMQINRVIFSKLVKNIKINISNANRQLLKGVGTMADLNPSCTKGGGGVGLGFLNITLLRMNQNWPNFC